jgi:hypothetical protein
MLKKIFLVVILVIATSYLITGCIPEKKFEWGPTPTVTTTPTPTP